MRKREREGKKRFSLKKTQRSSRDKNTAKTGPGNAIRKSAHRDQKKKIKNSHRIKGTSQLLKYSITMDGEKNGPQHERKEGLLSGESVAAE